MQLHSYQDQARATAIYPEQYAIAYPALGLIGELSELNMACRCGATTEDIIKEAGDVMWYCAILCYDMEVCLHTLCLPDVDLGPVPHLNELGVFAENTKKYLRDGKLAKRKAMLDFVYQVVGAVASLSLDLGVSFDEILETNIKKLQSRKERGVLEGDGDNR